MVALTKRISHLLLVALLASATLLTFIPQKAYATGLVPINDPNITWSKYNWVTNGTNYKQTVNSGAYLKFAFTGTTLGLNVDTSMFTTPDPDVVASGIILSAYIDGNPTALTETMADASGGLITFTNSLSAGNHTVQIFIQQNSNLGARWNAPGPYGLVRIESIQLAVGETTISSSGTSVEPYNKTILYYGDSITEGRNIGGTPAEATHAAVVGRELEAEMGQVGFAAQAWGTTFISGTPGLYYYEPAYNTASSWRNYYGGATMLNDGNDISSGYAEGTPDAVINNMGVNDMNLSAAEMTDRISGWLGEVRQTLGARPAIIMVVPFNYNGPHVNAPTFKAAYLQGIQDYQTANPNDSRIYTIDLGANGYDIVDNNSVDDLHPNPTGSQLLGELIAAEAAPYIILDTPLSAQLNGTALSDGIEVTETPTFTGTAPAYSTITVTINSDPITCVTTADANGDWSCTVTEAVPAGTHTVTVVAVTTWGETITLASYTIIVPDDLPAGSTIDQDSILADTGVSIYLIIAFAGLFSITGVSTWLLNKKGSLTVLRNR